MFAGEYMNSLMRPLRRKMNTLLSDGMISVIDVDKIKSLNYPAVVEDLP